MSYLHLRPVEARVHGLRAMVVVPRRAHYLLIYIYIYIYVCVLLVI